NASGAEGPRIRRFRWEICKGRARSSQRPSPSVVIIAITAASSLLLQHAVSSPMKSQSPLCIALFSLAALTFSAVPAMAAPHAKIRSEFTVTIDLLPPAAAPSTATGEVEIKVRQKDETEQTKFEISTSGLAAGSYSIDATDALGAVVHLGDFTPTSDDPATL